MEKNNKQESSTEKINESTNTNILYVDDWSELGDFVTSEEYCREIDEALYGK